MGQQITVTTRKVLADLANASLEARIVATFLDRLNNLEDPDFKVIETALKSNPKPAVTLRSSFPIDSEKSDRLVNILRKQIAEEIEINFEVVNGNSLCGIELNSGGYRIAWNLENYLEKLEAETVKALTENSKEVAEVGKNRE